MSILGFILLLSVWFATILLAIWLFKELGIRVIDRLPAWVRLPYILFGFPAVWFVVLMTIMLLIMLPNMPIK
jgi:hypothetical protein